MPWALWSDETCTKNHTPYVFWFMYIRLPILEGVWTHVPVMKMGLKIDWLLLLEYWAWSMTKVGARHAGKLEFRLLARVRFDWQLGTLYWHDEWLWARSPILWTHCPMVKAEKMRSEALRSSSKEQFASQGVPEQRNWSIPVGIRHELEVVVRCWLIDEECMYELHCVAAKWDWHHNSGRRTLRLSPLDASVDRASASNMLQNRIRFKSL